jgi:putative Mn2+ efflux pump MntP
MPAKLIALVVPLGLDTFAVALALGLAGMPARRRFQLSLWFAGFEAAMPLVGLAIGRPLGNGIGAAADYVAAAVLIALGTTELLRDDDDDTDRRLRSLAGGGIKRALLLGLSISLDELAIGFSAGLLRIPIGPLVAAVAVQAFALTQLGAWLGSRISQRAREGAEKLAGVALIALGVALAVAGFGA